MPKLKELVEKYGDKLLEKLANISDDKAKPSALSGYMGESLFRFWLEKYKNTTKVKYVADTEYAYDIQMENVNKFEVKTKVDTLYDEAGSSKSTAVYLRKNQFDYIEDNQNFKNKEKYFLVIISLADIGLAPDYSLLKVDFEELGSPNNLSNEFKKKIDVKIKSFLRNTNDFTSLQKDMKIIKLENAKDRV